MGSASAPWSHRPRTCVTATHAAGSSASSWRRWQLSITRSLWDTTVTHAARAQKATRNANRHFHQRLYFIQSVVSRLLKGIFSLHENVKQMKCSFLALTNYHPARSVQEAQAHTSRNWIINQNLIFTEGFWPKVHCVCRFSAWAGQYKDCRCFVCISSFGSPDV